MNHHELKRALSIVLGVFIFMMTIAATLVFTLYVDWAYQSGVQTSIEIENQKQRPSNLAASIASAHDIESIRPICFDLAKYQDLNRNVYKRLTSQSAYFFREGVLFFLICFVFCGAMLLFAYLTLRKAAKNIEP